jgi:preprotein translocase subunit SecG
MVPLTHRSLQGKQHGTVRPRQWQDGCDRSHRHGGRRRPRSHRRQDRPQPPRRRPRLSAASSTQGPRCQNRGLFPYPRLSCRAFSLVLGSPVQMETLQAALPYAQIVLSLLLIVGIVLQQRGAGLGGAFGGDNFASTFYKRRGAEKFLFNATIGIAVLFVLAAIAGFLI